jgi:hypothetical protein
MSVEIMQILGEGFEMLEDEQVMAAVKKHNAILAEVNALNPDELPADCAKAQYLYWKAQATAWVITGFYKKRFRYYEAQAEISQADKYEEIRVEGFSEERKGTGTDGQYLSRKAKGEKLVFAAKYEGDFDRWRGIAHAYDNAINSLKDMMKWHMKEFDGR